jgi:hypothetical protein
MSDAKKKDHVRTDKKRRQMKDAVASRKALAQPARPQRDEVDTVKFKRGSDADRSRRAG